MPKPTVTITHEPEFGLGINVEGCTDAAAAMIVWAALAAIQRRLLAAAIVDHREHGIVGARTLPKNP